jgi:hypothetical protein
MEANSKWSRIERWVASTVLAPMPDYISDLAKWQEAPVPDDSDQGNRVVWLHAANHCRYEWNVFNKSGEPSARLKSESSESRSARPAFVPSAGRFRGASAFAAVDGGWLVGFNQGEFGAALYWFSVDGEHSYQISEHQVVAFVTLSDGIYAIEGLAHLGLYSNSSSLSPDAQKLYIGMRQFVAEFDLRLKKLRMLVPSAEFLNKLSDVDAEQIRKHYGG